MWDHSYLECIKLIIKGSMLKLRMYPFRVRHTWFWILVSTYYVDFRQATIAYCCYLINKMKITRRKSLSGSNNGVTVLITKILCVSFTLSPLFWYQMCKVFFSPLHKALLQLFGHWVPYSLWKYDTVRSHKLKA